MSDYESDSLSQPRRSDSKSELHRKTLVESTSPLGVNACPDSADFIPFDLFAKLGINISTRSAHQPGDRVGYVPLEESGSCKGERNFKRPQILRIPKEILCLPFCVTVAGPWVELGGSRG